jgi:hypothetical protein
MHFGYANPHLHVTSKMHNLQNPPQPCNLKLTSIFSAIFFYEHFSRHLHHHSCLIPSHTRAFTIAEPPTLGTLRMSTICVRGWWRGRRPMRPHQGRARRDVTVMLPNSLAPAARNQRSSSGARSPTTSLSTLESSRRRAVTSSRSLTSKSDGGEAGGSNRMFEMFLENNNGFIKPTEPSQTGSTGGRDALAS